MNSTREWFAVMVSACLLCSILMRDGAAAEPQAPTPIVLHYREVPVFLGPHEHWATAVAFSKDGRIATGAADGYLRIWDATTGQLKSVLGEDATRGIQSIAFSPDNRFIAVVGGIFDKDVVVWDTATSEIVQQFQQPQAVSSEAKSPEETPFIYKGKPIAYRTLNAVAYSPDGQIIAAAGDNVVLYDSQSGDVRATLKHPTKSVKGLAFSADGNKLVTASGTKVCLWSMPMGELTATLKGPVLPLTSVAISSDGDRIVATTDGVYLPDENHTLIGGGQLWEWEQSTGKARQIELGMRAGRAVAFATPSQVVLGAGRDVLLVNLQDESPAPRKLWSHSDDVFAVTVSPDRTKVATASRDRTADVIDLANETLVYRLPGLNDIIGCVATSSDGKNFVTATSDERFSARTLGDASSFARRFENYFAGDANSSRFQPSEVRVWSTPDGVMQSMLPLDSSVVTAMACIPRSQLLAVAGWTAGKSGMLALWDFKNLKKIRDFQITGSEVLTISASPDGKTLASGDGEGHFDLWSVQSGANQLSIKHDRRVEAVAFSASGQLVAVGDGRKKIRVYQASDGALRQTRSCNSYLKSLAFSPDESLLAVGTQSPGMELLDLHTDGPSRVLQAPGDSFAIVPGYVAFSPDGRFIVCVGHGKNLAVFDADSGALHGELEGHYHAPTAVAFLPNGRLVSGAQERTIRLWDVETSRRLATWVVMPSDQRQQWNEQWIGYTTTGKYVSSTDQSRLIGWQIGGDVFTKDDAGSPMRVKNLFRE